MNIRINHSEHKHDKKARELMSKYPNYITPDILRQEIPDEQERRDVFGRMVYLAQCDKNDELFGG